MFGNILKIIGEGKVSSIENLSEKLRIGPEITRVMVDDLVRRGYLRERRGDALSSGESSFEENLDGCCASNTEGVIFWELAR